MRTLIVDDEMLVRSALRVFLQDAGGIEVCGDATSGEEAIALAATLKPDVVLMDVQMPGIGGIEATTQLVQKHPDLHVVALTTFSTERTIVPMLRAGATGFLVKDTEPSVIVDAVRQAHLGNCVLSPMAAERLVAAVSKEKPAQKLLPEEELTEREQEVVELLARGMSNAEIAEALFLTEGTVKAHFGHIMVKWNKRDRVQVLIHAARSELVSLG